MLSPFMKGKSDKTFSGRLVKLSEIKSVYLSFIQYCEREGYPVPSKITSEFDRRIKQAEKGDTKAKLNLSDTGIDDNYMIGLVTALAVSPIISRLDLHNNHISTKSATYILRLLRGQVKLVRTVPLEQRLNANFLGHVDFSPSDNIDPKTLEEIKKYAEETVDASFLHTSYKAVLGRTPSKQHLMDTITAYASASSDALTYEEFEESLMQEMQEAGLVPTLSKLQYSLIPNERPQREITKSPPQDIVASVENAAQEPIPSTPPPPERTESASPPIRRQLTPSPAPSPIPSPSPSPMKRTGSGLSEASYSLSPKTSFTRSESNSPALNKAFRKQASTSTPPPAKAGMKENVADAQEDEEYLSLSDDESDDELDTNCLSAKLFRIIDRNGDGQLTLIEFVTALRAHSEVAEMLNLPRIIRQEDGSRDKCVRVFNDIDANNDGIITLQKFHKYFKNMNNRNTEDSSRSAHAADTTEDNKSLRRQLTHEESPVPSVQSSSTPPVESPVVSPPIVTDDSAIVNEAAEEPTPDPNDISIVSSQAPQEPYQEEEYGAECKDNILYANNLRLVVLNSLTRILDNVSHDRKLKYLHTIILSGNYITEVDTSILSGLALPRLKFLDLSCNAISKITGNGFPATLQTLNLSQNKLKRIKGVGSCVNLKELNVSNNKIKIADGLPPSLHVLNLANNLIEGDFNLRILSICTHLTSLHLVGNPLAKDAAKCRIRMLSMLPELKEYDGVALPKPRKVELPSEEWKHQRKEDVIMDRKAQQLADEQRSRVYLNQMQWREKHRQSMLAAYESMAKRSNVKKISAEELEKLTNRLCKTNTTSSANHLAPPPPPPVSPKRKIVARPRRDASPNKSQVVEEEHRQETREEWCDRHNALLTMSQANIVTLYDGLIEYSKRITDTDTGPSQNDTDSLAALMDQCFHEISALIAALSIARIPGTSTLSHDEAQLESDIYHCHRILKYVSDALSRRMSLGELIQTLESVCIEMRGRAVDWSRVAKKCYGEENFSPGDDNHSPAKDIGVPVPGLNVPKGVVPSKSTEQLYQHQDSIEEKPVQQRSSEFSVSSIPDASMHPTETHKREFIADDISSINSVRESKVPRHPRDSDTSKHSTNGRMDPDEVFRRMENLKGRMMTRASASPSVVSQQERMSEISTASVDDVKERRPSTSSVGRVDTEESYTAAAAAAIPAPNTLTTPSISTTEPSKTLPPAPSRIVVSDDSVAAGEDSVSRLLAKLRDISQETSAKEVESIVDDKRFSPTPVKATAPASTAMEWSSPALLTVAEKTVPVSQTAPVSTRKSDDGMISKDRSQDANEVDSDPSPTHHPARELSFSYSGDSEAGFQLPVNVKGGKPSISQPYLPGKPPVAKLQYVPPADSQSLVSESPRDSETTTDSRQKKKGFFSTVKRSLSFRKKPSL